MERDTQETAGREGAEEPVSIGPSPPPHGACHLYRAQAAWLGDEIKPGAALIRALIPVKGCYAGRLRFQPGAQPVAKRGGKFGLSAGRSGRI
jgi:hypothetical protein